MPKEFPGASYDHWKTTDPRDYEPENKPERDPDQDRQEWLDRKMEDADPQTKQVQCNNCLKMFDPEDDDCFIGFHPSVGDTEQCGDCIRAARANFPFSGSF